MNDELDQLLTKLGLKTIRSLLPEAIEKARAEQPDYQDFLLSLVRAQWGTQQEKALAWRIKNATLPEAFTLESFPFSLQPGVNRRQIMAFASLDFVPKAQNIVFIGKAGTGKTGLASGLLIKAMTHGYRCRFISAQSLFDEMYASLADRSTKSLLDRLFRIDVLAIDGLSSINPRPEQSNIFFKLVEERYKKKPIIITTSLTYEEWPNFLGNRVMTEALLDRLRHQCHTVVIDGPSLRQPLC